MKIMFCEFEKEEEGRSFWSVV